MNTILMKSILLSSITLSTLLACSPQTKNRSENEIINPKIIKKQKLSVPKSEVMVKKAAPGNAYKQAYSHPIHIIRPNLSDQVNTEKYNNNPENELQQAHIQPVSTFSVDVDTGSYTNSRRMLNMGKLPPSNAVRIEEFINYFDYQYQSPANINTPFKVYTEVAPAPWDHNRQLLKIGLKGFEIDKSSLNDANLVFLLDVSGSMKAENKLPLLKRSLLMLSKQLDQNDTVSIVVYAGAAGVVLEPTKGNEYHKISMALAKLQAGGSTNGGSGITLAYQLAQQNFKKEGVNRVILATDGDFNVGTKSVDELKELIIKNKESGITLTTLGFGHGNYNDALMEQLADIGNGHHAYIDNINEARKVLVDEISATMQIIAKDVKIQVEFNPDQISEYRLIGYQNRLLKQEDFNNDKVDAGEMGAGHTVTALYELTLSNSKNKRIDKLRYQNKIKKITELKHNELAFIKLRYKAQNSNISQLISKVILRSDIKSNLEHASDNFGFSVAVSGFAQLLKGGKYTQRYTYHDVIELAKLNKGSDDFGYRAEFIQLVRTAEAL
ncbi:VWA domain-containing protein [Pseudoalteromonas sp. NBT06-2]|uniref:vWA domain-containing protein n=1 Tax=Pseudoalteromonas sp. NBT06-2 TaxID=2025950 RepID=UPI002074AF69|nr:VWA domain-containing protein [Pseudoalteromonas sp. NBT06-2]